MIKTTKSNACPELGNLTTVASKRELHRILTVKVGVARVLPTAAVAGSTCYSSTSFN